MRALLIALTGLLAACGDKAGGGSCPSEPLDGLEATVDGAAWSAADVSFSADENRVQILTSSEGAGWISVVAQTTADGSPAGAALLDGALPITVTLATGAEGGFATWYPEEGSAVATTQGGGGTLTLAALEDGALTGCLSFTAGADGAGVSLEDGHFTAFED